MATLEVLKKTPSRRSVLQTGVKVAYVTPVVLATMKAAPAFAQGAPHDVSEDKTIDDLSNAALLALTQTFNITGGVATVTAATTAAVVQNAVTAFNNDITSLQGLISDINTQLASMGESAGTTLGGLPTINYSVPAVGLNISLGPGSTVQQGIDAITAIYTAEQTQLNNLLNAIQTSNTAAANTAAQNLNLLAAQAIETELIENNLLSTVFGVS